MPDLKISNLFIETFSCFLRLLIFSIYIRDILDFYENFIAVVTYQTEENKCESGKLWIKNYDLI